MRLRLFIGLMLVFATFGVAAQDDDLTVYVYEPVIGELMRVDGTGNMESYALGFENTRFIQIGGMEINDAGTQVAFCYIDHNQTQDAPRQATFVIRDIMAETNVLTVDLGDAAACQTGEYSPDESQITIAHVVYETFFPEQQLDPNRPSWRLLILDTTTGDIVRALDGNQPDAPTISFGDMDAEQILARTVAFTEDRVLFQAVPYLPTEVFVDSGYAWNLDTGELQPMPSLANMTYDYAPGTGELVFAAQSDTLPLPQAMGMGPVYNAIRYQPSLDAEPQTLFESSQESVGRIQFAFNGNRILAALNDSSDMMAMQSRWVLLALDGTITGEIGLPNIVRTVADVGNGLIVQSEEEVPQSFPTTVLSYYDGETLTEFWRYPFPEDQESYAGFNLVWASGS